MNARLNLPNNSPLSAELEFRQRLGQKRVTIREFEARLNALGYTLDRDKDCRCNSRYMTGERAGASYPCITTSARERDSGKGYAHFDARRDANFRALQKLRGEIFAVTRGAIFEL
jgi:hypothetical protein